MVQNGSGDAETSQEHEVEGDDEQDGFADSAGQALRSGGALPAAFATGRNLAPSSAFHLSSELRIGLDDSEDTADVFHLLVASVEVVAQAAEETQG